MDNPQHYQPLSHALNPPPSVVRTHYAPAGHHTGYIQHPANPLSAQGPQDEEEEEEEEEDDEDEGMVEDQLHPHDSEMQGSGPSSPKGSSNQQASAGGAAISASPEKRRPGRPRGSKNRKPRASTKHETQFYAGQQPAPAGLPAPPSHPSLTPQNQQYYEFQWRMLNLCAEFYGAAEELVKGTSPLVIAQSYQLGPGVKVDPLAMLADAKRVCDTLLGNPSQLFSNPPASVYPIVPTPVYQPLVQPSTSSNPSHPTPMPAPTVAPATTPAAVPTGPTPPAPVPGPAPTIITNPQSFVVPLGQPAYAGYPVYSAAPQYPTTPYYHQYGYGAPYYPQHPPPGAVPVPVGVQPQPIASTSATPAPSSSTTPTATTAASAATTVTMTTKPTTATITTTPATGGTMIGNSGQWSDEESDRLRRLADDSKRRTSTGEADWDWVVAEWGPTRTRHQILLQANKLSLKESTTRGTKRRRGDDGGHSSSTPVMSSLQASTSMTSSAGLPPPSMTPTIPNSTTTTASATPVPMSVQTASPAQSTTHSASTPAASPALQNLTRPPSSKGLASTPASTTTPKLPWPMPTVAAVNSPSVLPTASATSSPAAHHPLPHSAHIAAAAAQDARSSYYRPRPTIGPSTSPMDSTKSHQQQHHQPLPQQQTQHQTHYGHHPGAQQHPMVHSPHQYMYTPNGQMATYRPKENGK